MRKKKMALWGSCVTRDIFNTAFVKEYKDNFEVFQDQQHVSVISMMSQPVDIDLTNLDGSVTNFYKNVFKEDMTKQYLEKLKKEEPEILIIDFYTDVFYGAVLDQDGAYLTNKIWQYKKLNTFSQIKIKKEYSIYHNTLAFISLWKQSFDEFMIFMKKYAPNTRIIVNKARFVNLYRVDGEDDYIQLTDKLDDKWEAFHINRFNILWELFDTYAIEKYHLDYLDFDIDNYYCADDHLWGEFYVHYNAEYYRNTFNLIIELLEKNEPPKMGLSNRLKQLFFKEVER